MDPSASSYRMSTSIQPYYSRGDVFQRDQRYYDQTPSIRRTSRTPKKGRVNADSSVGKQVNSTVVKPADETVNGQTSNQQYFTQILGNPQTPAPISTPEPAPTPEPDILNLLRSQNIALTQQLQKLTYNGQFGTGDTVHKLTHYTATKIQNEQIKNQEKTILELQEQIRKNNQKLGKYQQASSQLEIRINNIQAIDKEIYKQLRSASTRDRELLDRAGAMLARGEGREAVLRVLEQIVLN